MKTLQDIWDADDEIVEKDAAPQAAANEASCDFYHIRGKFTKKTTLTQNTLGKDDILRLRGSNGPFYIDKTTFIPNEIHSGEEFDVLLCEDEDGKRLASLALPSSMWTMFADSSIQTFAKRISFYAHLTPERKQMLFNQRFLPDSAAEESGESYFFSREECRAFADLLSAKMTGQQFRFLKGRLKSSSIGKEDSEVLQYFVSTLPYGRENDDAFDAKNVLSAWNHRYYGRISEKKQILSVLAAAQKQRCKSGHRKVLLVGNPGTGKTAFARTFGEVIGKPFESVPIRSLTSALDLTGCSRSYNGSRPGMLASAFTRAGTTDIVLLLDGIEGALYVNGTDGSLANAVIEFLSDDYFTDNYYTFPVALTNTFIICTCSSLADVPPAMLDCFDETIVFPDFTADEKLELTKTVLIPQEELRYHTENEPSILDWDDAAIMKIIRYYAPDSGCRGIQSRIRMVYERCIARLDTGRRKKMRRRVSVGSIDALYASENATPAQNLYRAKDFFPPDEWNNILRLMRDAADSTDAKQKKVATKSLELLADMLPKAEDNVTGTVSPDDLRQELDKKLYGMDGAKNALCRYLWSRNNCAKESKTLLLTGTPGTGKTTIAMRFAEACHLTLVKISLAGLSPESLSGASSHFGGSLPGMIVDGIAAAMRQNDHKPVLLLLDEIDKVPEKTAALLSSLLDDSQMMWTDEFIGFSVKLPIYFFIATANDAGKIPHVLCSRMEIVHLDAYTEAEKEEIVEHYLIPDFEKQYQGSMITIEKEAVRLLVKRNRHGGMRDVRHALSRVIETKAMGDSLCAPFSLSVTAKCVNDILGPDEMDASSLSLLSMPGVVLGLCVNGEGMGDILPIQAVCRREEGKTSCLVYGNVSKVVDESAATAYACLLENGLIPSDVSFRIYYRDLAVPKDGPSSGAAMAVAMYLAANHLSALAWYGKTFAVTGEITVDGSLLPVGGIREKVSAAAEAGVDTVFLPALTSADKCRGYEQHVARISNLGELVNEHPIKKEDN